MARKILAEILNGETRFGRLTVLREASGVPRPGNGEQRRVLCCCDCGIERTFYIMVLKRGEAKSCGCLRREISAARRLTHGDRAAHKVTPEYRAWADMLSRCTNPNVRNYANYGGRGIKVCAAWRASYEAFLADMGRRPSSVYSLDRWPNNDGDYEPGNVRWADDKTQMRNTRINRWVEFRGERICLNDAAEKYGLKRATLAMRLKLGWSVEDALTLPVC